MISRANDGQPLAGKIRSAWEGILEDAGDDVVRLAAQHRGDLVDAARHQSLAGRRWLGMTLEELENNDGHHHRDFQGEVAPAFSGKH